MTEAFFKILLALLIFIPTIMWGAKLFAGTNQAEDSFESLVRYVDAMAQDSSLTSDSIPLYMDENTFIMFINPEVKSVWGKFLINFAYTDFFFDRPYTTACKIDESCICLCKDYDKGTLYHDDPNEPDYPNLGVREYYKPICNKLVCTSTEAKFTANIYDKKGIIIQRKKDDARLRTLYIEKYEEYLGLCFDSPCISKQYRVGKNLLKQEIYLKEKQDE